MTDRDAHRPAESVLLPPRGWRIDARHALIAAILCWAGFAAIVAMVEAGRGGSFDAVGLELWREHGDLATPHGPAWLLEAVRDFTALGGALLRNLFALGAIVALMFLRLRREAVLLGATIVSGWLGELLMKALFARPRPTVVPHLMAAGGSSFPSASARVCVAVQRRVASSSARKSTSSGAVLPV